MKKIKTKKIKTKKMGEPGEFAGSRPHGNLD